MWNMHLKLHEKLVLTNTYYASWENINTEMNICIMIIKEL